MIGLVILSCLFFVSIATSDCQNCATIKGHLTNITRFSNLPLEAEIANVEVVLNPGNKKTSLGVNKEFSFYDVNPGTYRIDIYALNQVFDPVIFDVIPKGTEGYDIVAYILDAQAKKKISIPHPFSLPSKGAVLYFEIEEELSVMSIFKSGYGLMIGVTILMIFCAKNMPSMDEMEDANRAPNESVQQEERRQPAPQQLPRSGGRR